MTAARASLPATFVSLVLVWGLHAQPCLAQSPPAPSQAPSQSSPQSPPLDIMVALDNSGSMKRNDPNALMRSAVSEFAKRLAPGSRFGIVVFDTKAGVVLGLTPAGDPGFAEKVNETLARVDYAGQWTDISGGVEQAIYELREHGREGAQRAIVIFTDGEVDTGSRLKDVDRARWLQGSLAQEAKERGIRVYGIAFTPGADFQLMQSVAQTTGGEHFRVLAATDIARVFEQIRSRAPVAAVTPPAAVAAPPVAPSPPVADLRQPWGYLPWSLAFMALVAVGTAVWLARRNSGAGEHATSFAAQKTAAVGRRHTPTGQETIPDVPVRTAAAKRTGNCVTHSDAKAIAICPECKLEKCAKCIPVRDGVAVCVQCAEART